MSKTVRKITLVAVGVVAFVAALVSYFHMSELAHRAGEEWRSYLIPFAVDGMMVVASMVMLVRRKTRKPVGWLPWTALAFGLAASLAANVAVAEPTIIGRMVAAWPPVALAMAYEMLMEQIRVTAKRPTTRRPTTRRKPPAKRTTKSVPATSAISKAA